jgi:hypothetical protein
MSGLRGLMSDLPERIAQVMPRQEPQAAPIVNLTTGPTTFTMEAGAIPVSVTTPDVTVHTPEIRNEFTLTPTPVTVENHVEPTPVTVENHMDPTPVTVENNVTVDPTPVEITNTVSVDPTPVTVINEAPEPRAVTKTIVRDKKNQITKIVEETD